MVEPVTREIFIGLYELKSHTRVGLCEGATPFFAISHPHSEGICEWCEAPACAVYRRIFWKHDRDIVSARGESLRQCADHISEAAGLYEGHAFGGDECYSQRCGHGRTSQIIIGEIELHEAAPGRSKRR
jgi:hypothetical protein